MNRTIKKRIGKKDKKKRLCLSILALIMLLFVPVSAYASEIKSDGKKSLELFWILFRKNIKSRSRQFHVPREKTEEHKVASNIQLCGCWTRSWYSHCIVRRNPVASEEWFDAIPLFSYKKCNSKKKRIVGNFIPHLML